MTTAQIFADYCGLTPEGAPWAFDAWNCGVCGGYNPEYEPENCPSCGGSGECSVLEATSPLAPKPTPGWLEVLVSESEGLVLYGPCFGDPYCVARLNGELRASGQDAHPTHAVALALLAADPKLREACEQASDWEEVK